MARPVQRVERAQWAASSVRRGERLPWRALDLAGPRPMVAGPFDDGVLLLEHDAPVGTEGRILALYGERWTVEIRYEDRDHDPDRGRAYRWAACAELKLLGEEPPAVHVHAWGHDDTRPAALAAAMSEVLRLAAKRLGRVAVCVTTLEV